MPNEILDSQTDNPWLMLSELDQDQTEQEDSPEQATDTTEKNPGNPEDEPTLSEEENTPNEVSEDIEQAEPAEKEVDKEAQKEEIRRFGAKALTTAGFESRHKTIVDSSYEQARKKGEKLPGKNTERRNYAYISRMESLIEEHGSELEKRLWHLSASKLVINPKQIADAYWRSQEQILRDNGQGHELSEEEKQALTEDIQEKQRESLSSWSEYLGDEGTPYPMWFKVFAWDGMSKMGVFDKEKQRFAKRDEHTVAPFPKLNPAVLAKVYEAMSATQGETQSDKPVPPEITKLVQSGDFNGLYSHFLLEQKASPKTPERTEDIEGSWIEYKPGDEDALASAAEGTPWCVASPAAGRNYLSRGSFGTEAEESKDESQAKFILFHLKNPKTGQPSSTACASIRLDTEGKVAEISGLKEGQALEDSLVPIVEAKVRTLPGGEQFLRKFADKKQLIALDKKLQAGEDLTREELEFLYELHRPIEKLDTYNEIDPRIPELRKKYDIEYALEHGVPLDDLLRTMSTGTAIEHLDTLRKYGFDIEIDDLITYMQPETILEHIDTLREHGAKIDIDELAADIAPENRMECLSMLLKHGANVDKLVSLMSTVEILENLDTLLKHGAKIDIDKLISSTLSLLVVKHIDTLLAHGAKIDIDELAEKMHPENIARNLPILLKHGANADKLVLAMPPLDVKANKDILLSHGANPALIEEKLRS